MERRAQSLPPLLWMWTAAVVCLALACFAAETLCRHVPAFAHLPYTRPTLEANDDYVDYWMFGGRFPHYHSATFFDSRWGPEFFYPAPLGLFYEAAYLALKPLPHHTTFFVLTLLGLGAAAALLLFRALLRREIATWPALVFTALALVTSYPLYFAANRANMEVFVWVLAGAGIWAFLRGRSYSAAVLIGIAGACKFFPYIYVGLLLLRKQYRESVVALAVGGLTTLFSLWAITGNIALSSHKIAVGLDKFRSIYVLHRRPGEIGLDHSIFGTIKWFAHAMPPPEQSVVWLDAYLGIAAVTATAIFFLRVRKLPVLNQVCFLTVMCILLPPVSYDYTLLHVYTPWALFVLYAVECWKRLPSVPRELGYVFACSALLLSPQNEIIFHGERLEGVIKCLALLALAAVSLKYPFEEVQSPSLSKVNAFGHANESVPSSPVA